MNMKYKLRFWIQLCEKYLNNLKIFNLAKLFFNKISTNRIK